MVGRIREQWNANGFQTSEELEQQRGWWDKVVGGVTRSLVQAEKSSQEFNKYADEMALKFHNLQPIMDIMTENLHLCYGIPRNSSQQDLEMAERGVALEETKETTPTDEQ